MVSPIPTIARVVLAGMVLLVAGAFADQASAGMITAVGSSRCESEWLSGATSSRAADEPAKRSAEEDETHANRLAGLPSAPASGAGSPAGSGPVCAAISAPETGLAPPNVSYLHRQRTRVLFSPPHDSGLFRPPQA